MAGAWPFERVDLTNPEAFGYLFAFGADRQGELYVLSSSTIRTDRTEGKVMKIVPAD